MDRLFSSRPRPLLITIAAIVLAVLGVGNICFGATASVGNVLTLGLAPGTFFGGTGSVILGILRLVMAGGLWSGQGWARWVVIILSGLTVLGIIAGGLGAGEIINLIIQGLLIAYMFSDEVKRYFRA